MIKKIVLIVSLLFGALSASATTLYMATTGSDTTGSGTQASPYRTLSKCLSLLVSGQNTIVVANGIYASGFTVDNTIISGSSWANFLTIQAQTDFGVRVTQTNALNMATSKTYFMFMRGIIFDGLYQKSICGASAFFYRCGFKGGQTSGNVSNTNIGSNDFGPPGATDMSFEECFFIGYSTGSGRYQAIVYNATNCVLRRCVFHSENGWNDGGSANPSADLTVYNTRNVAVENCFSIDSMAGFVPNTYTYGQFLVIDNSGQPQQTDFLEYYGNMAVKGASYGMWIESAATAISSMTVKNFAVIDSSNAIAMGYGANLNMTLDGFTFLRASDTATSGYAFNYGSGGTKVIRNGIVSGWTQGMAGSATPITYTDWFNSGSAPGTTGQQTYNPRTNGLTYFPRIEAASNLKTAGLSGGQMGAQIVNQTGYFLTRYGVANYNVLSSTPLFPLAAIFETAIKSEFCDGYNRGFCAASASGVTLTQYLNAYSTSPYATSSVTTSTATPTVTAGVATDTVTVTSGRFGTFIGLYSLYGSSAAYYNECSAAKAIGTGIFSGNHDMWDVVEASSGAAYNFTTAPTGTGMSFDTLVRLTTGTAAGECGSDLLLEVPVAAGWTPSYVATTTQNPYLGRQNARTRYANNDMGLLSRYVTNVVTHYGHSIKYIDTAREPDNTNYFLGSNSTFPATSDYFSQLKTVSQAAKAADATITVVCGHIAFPIGVTNQILPPGSVAGYAAAYPTGHYYLSDLLSKGATQYCDVWALDYFRGGEGGNTTLLQSVSSMTSVLANYGVTTPRIWVTEYAKEGTSNYSSTNTANEEFLKANYLYQDYATAFSTGVEKIFYQTFSGLDYSLMDASLNPYAVYYCLGQVFNMLNGYSFYQNLDNGSLSGKSWKKGTSIRYEFHTTSGAQTYAFPGPLYKGYLADTSGNINNITADNLNLYPISTTAFFLDILPPAVFVNKVNFQKINLKTQ